MDKNTELYYEEQRQNTLELKKSIDSLVDIFSEKVSVEIKPIEKVKIDGKLEVNTEKEIEVTNLDLVTDALKNLGDVITSLLEQGRIPEKIAISNIEQAKPDTVKINNLDELKKYINEIKEAIQQNKSIVNVTKQQIKFPTLAKDAIPVRLSDGKAFYKAIATAIGGGFNATGLATASKQDEIITAIGTIGGNATALYTYVQKDTDGTTYKYYGYMKSDGGWYIKRITISTNLAEFVTGASDYSTNWTGRAGLSYTPYSDAF
jgi:hypothetical protein